MLRVMRFSELAVLIPARPILTINYVYFRANPHDECDPEQPESERIGSFSAIREYPDVRCVYSSSGNATLEEGAVGAKSQLTILSVVLFALFFVASPQAEAQRGRSVGKPGGALRSIGKVPNVRAAQALGDLGRAAGRRQASPFPVLDAISRTGGGRAPSSQFPVLDAISRANSGGRNYSGSPFPVLDAITRASNGGSNYPSTPFPILEALSRIDDDDDKSSDVEKFLYGLSQFGGYGGYGYPGYGAPGGYGAYGANSAYPYYNSYYHHKSQEEYADAYRDAAIANAVGNVVSAIVSSPSVRTPVPAYVQQTPVYTQPAPVYTQPAPAQTYVQPNPLGHYETRREQVGGGYYQREQIWVPEARDPRTGNIVEGHYETVKRWVPEVIQETRVWVAP